ncbi:MAG TPA: hypothetical protein VGL06_30540, partial [Pseudonocardiaceae bacterium]
MRSKVEVSVAGSRVTPGFGRGLRRIALRLAVGAGLAVFAWLLSSTLSAGTAAAAQNPHGAAPSDSSPSGTDGGGLLGGLLGGLGNTLSSTVSGVTDTVSALTTTVSSVTTGVVGGLANGLTDTLHTVTGVVAPVTTGLTGTSGGGTHVGSDPKPAPVVVTTPTAPAAQQAVSVPVVAAPAAPAAAPFVLRHVTTSVAPQKISTTTPTAPMHAAPRLPSRPLPVPPPQPAPTPAVPASFVSTGHGLHGPARHALGAFSSDTFAPFLAAFGVHS